jgi:PAS domain S-box-containing protein
VTSNERPTILVVDDEQSILDALEDLLEDDFTILKATSGVEGLKLMDQHTVSVVLSDQKMPGMKGEEFLARVAASHVTTRVLLTGYTDFEDLVRAVNRGHIYAFVSKPWSPHQLRSLVRMAAERFDLERKLVHEKNLLDLLLEHTPDLISIKDSQGRYLRLNRAYARALGASDPEELLGRTDEELGGGLFPEAPERERRVLEQGDAEMDLTEKSCREPRWYSSTRVATPSREVPPLLIGISRDITERLESNRQLERHAAQLQRMNQELSRVSFIVAHHLQEPLRWIGSFIDLLQRRNLLKDGAEEYIGYVHDGVQRAKSLMRDFSAYLDTQQPATRETVRLSGAIEAALSSLRAEHPEVAVRCQGDASIPGYPESLVRLFHSLLDNALVHGRPEEEVLITIEPRGGQVRVVIEDKGPGIPEEDHCRVFQLFETLETGSRSGLGLALCQKIVGQHGGKIWLENRESGGLRVIFTLSEERDPSTFPSLPQPAPEPPPRTPDPPPPPSTPVIQEEASDTRLQERLARMESFATMAAHDMSEPLRVIKGYLELLERREGASLSEAGTEYLGYAVNATKRMKALLDGLLTHAVSGRPVGGAPRPMHELLPEVLEDLAQAIREAQAEITIDRLPNQLLLGEVEGRLLLSNLIGNALKYRGQARPEISISAQPHGEGYLVEVTDNGIGVPRELAKAIFQPFVRGDHDRAYRGSGLGLATCDKLVKGWGGRIWCEERPEGGTRFFFTVPSAEAAHPAPATG